MINPAKEPIDVPEHLMETTMALAGSIWVKNTGGFVARFSVQYEQDGKEVTTDSGEFTTGMARTVLIPADAKHIQVKIEEEPLVNSWSIVCTFSFDEPVKKCYEVFGTTLDAHCKEVQCPVTQFQLTAINNILTFADTSAKGFLRAYADTMALAQTHTIDRYHQEHGPNAPVNFTSQEVFNIFSQELQNVYWKVVSSTSTHTEGSQGSPPVFVIQIQINDYDPAQWATVGRLFQALARSIEGDAKMVLDFWWSSATSLVMSDTHFAIGPLTVVDGQPSLAMIFYYLNLDLKNLADLFFPQAQAYDVTTRLVQLSLQMDQYESHKDQIRDQAASLLTKHVKQTSLAF